MPLYPACYDNAGLIAVASSDHKDALSGFSNYGLISVDLAAPGTAIMSTLPGNRYVMYSGTSMAAPHVAGAAALLWAYDPSLSTTEVKSRLLQTVDARPAFANRMVSGGRLNVHAAILAGSSVPAAPTSLVATANSRSKITLRWSDRSNNERGFRIERMTTGGTWTQIAAVGANVRTSANTGLTAGTTYTYRVLAYNDSGVSGYSNEASATTPGGTAGKPSAPNNLVATAISRTQINLTWLDTSSNEQGFRIERKLGSAAWVPIATLPANATRFANPGLKPNTTYRYRVRAFNTNGASTWATSAAIKTPR
jgi:hypothetical protein